MGDIKLCIDLKMLEVKVPTIFFGTPGFSARRDGRYATAEGPENRSCTATARWIHAVRERVGLQVEVRVSGS